MSEVSPLYLLTKTNSAMKTTVFVSKKKSGNLTMTSYMDANWELIFEAKTPKELKEKMNLLGLVNVVVSEYSQSQLKKVACKFSEKDALKAFGMPYKKADVLANF